MLFALPSPLQVWKDNPGAKNHIPSNPIAYFAAAVYDADKGEGVLMMKMKNII